MSSCSSLKVHHVTPSQFLYGLRLTYSIVCRYSLLPPVTSDLWDNMQSCIHSLHIFNLPVVLPSLDLPFPATSDCLEAISEAASSHSVGSDLEGDNLSDMVSANVSGRGTPNISGRDTPVSQVGTRWVQFQGIMQQWARDT